MVAISNKKWQKYNRIVSDFLDNDSAKKPITWLKALKQPTLFSEDGIRDYYSIPLEVLIADNSFRTWPINQTTPSGELDNQNLIIWVSKRYLEEKGHINESGYLDFDRSLDRFIIDGLVYKSSGDTLVAQAHDEQLAIIVVLKREVDEDEVDFKVI